MNKMNDLRAERRRTTRGMSMAAFAGIAGVLALAAVALWFSWDKSMSQQTQLEVDPMSLVG
jgi:formiminotetrahydrofolate cyclodeaminase